MLINYHHTNISTDTIFVAHSLIKSSGSGCHGWFLRIQLTWHGLKTWRYHDIPFRFIQLQTKLIYTNNIKGEKTEWLNYFWTYWDINIKHLPKPLQFYGSFIRKSRAPLKRIRRQDYFLNINFWYIFRKVYQPGKLEVKQCRSSKTKPVVMRHIVLDCFWNIGAIST